MSKRRNVTRKIGRRRYGGNNPTIGYRVGTGVNNITSTADSAAGTIVGTVQGAAATAAGTASDIASKIGSTAHQGATMFNDTVDGGINTINKQLQNTFTSSNPNMPLYNQKEEEEEKPWWKSWWLWGGRRRKTKKRNNKRRKTKSHKRKGNKSKRKVNKRRSNKRGGGKVPVHGPGHHRPHGYGNPYLASKNHLQGLSPSGHNSKLTMSRVRPDGMIDGLGGGSRKRKGGKKRMKGGGGPAQPWMPQDLVNAYRGTIGMGVDALNTWQGRPENISANPYPTQKQLYGQDIKVLGRKYPDISANYDTATSTVASL